MSPRKPATPPIHFTKDELQMIELGVKLVVAEWLNGNRGTGRAYTATRVLEKVRHALNPKGAVENSAVSPSTEGGER